MNKGYIVCSIMVIIIGVQFAMFLNLNSKYASLSSDYSSLIDEYQALTTTHDSLSQNHSSLESDYTNLQLQYDALQIDLAILQSKYGSLEANYTSAKAENEDLKAQYNALSAQFINLTANYTTLKSQYTDLIQDYTSLQSQYDEVTTNYTSLQITYQNLQTNYTNLEVQYESLQSNYTILQTDYETLQAQYNSSQSLYDDLQAEYNRYVTAYQRLRDEINHRWNQQNLENFITPEDSTVNTFVLSITGGWSNPDDWDEYWDDLKAMYNWVVSNVEYRYDGLYPMLPYDPSGNIYYWTEMWQFPNETLSMKKGDCEDMAILLCSMIRCYGDMQYVTECIGITSSTAGHLAVQCPVEGYTLVIFDPAGRYYSHDWLGNIVFNDISTEINNWLDYWKPTMGSDVYVNLVFSDYIHETFMSNDDYIAWMYSR